MDVFQELEEQSGMPKDYISQVLDQIDSMWDNDVLFIDPPKPQEKYFTRPNHREAGPIWDACHFRLHETKTTIESGLWDWACNMNAIVVKDGVNHVCWMRNTTQYIASWPVFLRWFFCILES